MSARWDDENRTTGFFVALSILWIFVLLFVAFSHRGWIPRPTPHLVQIAGIAVFLFALNEWLNVCFNAIWRRHPPTRRLGMILPWWHFEWVGGSVRYGIDYWRRSPIHWLKITAVSGSVRRFHERRLCSLEVAFA